MARPTKATVDYFPHLTTHGKTMYIIERKFGNDGYAVWFKTLELLGSSDNHYLDGRIGDQWEYMMAKFGVEESKVVEIFDCLANLQAISKSLWKQRIIFSENFIKMVSDVYKRRQVEMPTKIAIIEICGLKNKVNANRNGINANKKPQSKVNKTKENYGDLKNVKLKKDEYEKLIKRFGEKTSNEKINNLSYYIKSKGDKYRDHYATILSWARMDDKEKKSEADTSSHRIFKNGFKLPKGKTCSCCGFYYRCEGKVKHNQIICTAGVTETRYHETMASAQ